MLDFMNFKDLPEDLKIKEFYELFKTNSLEFNSKLLLILQKYPSFKNLIKHFTKFDINDIPNIFNDLTSASFKIINEEKNDISDSNVESYICGISKIILLLFLIQQNNQLIINIVKTTKNFIENFFSRIKKECINKKEFIKVINKLISYEQMNPSIKDSILKNKIENINKISKENEESILMSTNTPRFEYLENFDKSNNSLKMTENIKKKSAKLDSTLSLQKMKFVQMEDDPEIMNLNKVKKSISNRIKKKHKSLEPRPKCRNKRNSIKKKESLFKIKEEGSEEKSNESQNERIKILTVFFDSINTLYKNGKINSKQKIKIKQIIVSEPQIIIEKFYQHYHNIIKNYDRDLLNTKIQTFLLEELFCIY